MIQQILKRIATRKLMNELRRAKNAGHILYITDITEVKIPGGDSEICGVEIIFDDNITDKQVCKLRDYIQAVYKFKVDTSLVEKNQIPKILIVEY